MNAVHGDLPRIGLIGAFTEYPDALASVSRAAAALHALSGFGEVPGSGATLHDDIARLAATSDVVICNAEDERQFAEFIAGLRCLAETARSGLVVLDISRISPVAFRDAAAACKAAGVRLCGAALHVRAAVEGRFLASADDETFRDGRLMRVLETFSDEVHRVGGTGSSKAVAVIEGHLAAVSVAASAEAIRLGSAAGIPEGRLVPLLLNGSAANAVLRSGRLGDDGGRAPKLLRAWLKRSNDLCRSVRHPSWFGAVASASLGRFSPSSATRPALAGGAA